MFRQKGSLPLENKKKITGCPLVVKRNRPVRAGLKKTGILLLLLRYLTEWFVRQKVNLRCWKRAIFFIDCFFILSR